MSGSRPFVAGRIAVLGRPNAGKSTLVNRLVGTKVAIVSATPQTTRSRILGVRNDEDTQFVFVDTPGVHLPRHALNRRMMEEVQGALEEVDLALHVIDAADRPGRGDAFVADRIRASGLPRLTVLNKIDLVRPKGLLLPLMERFGGDAAATVPISATHGDGLDDLLAEIRRLLPEGPAQLPRDVATDQTERFLVAELIREKVLDATRQEIPHATAVLVDRIEEKVRDDGRHVLVIEASLAVEKESQKAILIGRGADMLKRLGIAARQDIETQLEVTCHLGLHVKVIPRWRESRRVLAEIFEGSRGAGMPMVDLVEALRHGGDDDE